MPIKRMRMRDKYMLNTNEQTISNGDGNIQAQGNVDNSRNYFIDYKPAHITFYEQDIFAVIEDFNRHLDLFEENGNENITDKEFENIEKPEKNRLNKLSDEYFDTICEEFLPYFYKIDKFLKAPQNKSTSVKYRKIAQQLKVSIAANRRKFDYFEEILDDIVATIVGAIRENKQNFDVNVIIVFLNYMYWNCDIGRRH